MGWLPWWGEWRVFFKGQVSLAGISATALRIPVQLGPFLPALPWVGKTGTLASSGGLLGCRAWLWRASPRHLVPLGAAGTWASSSRGRGGAAVRGWGEVGGAGEGRLASTLLFLFVS